jgi:hypothetical protein
MCEAVTTGRRRWTSFVRLPPWRTTALSGLDEKIKKESTMTI